MSESFSRIITMLRKEKKISQKEAAQQLGVSQALLSHYERGIRECKLEFVVKAADYYGVSCDYLLGRSPEKTGATISCEDIAEPDCANDQAYRGSILPTLNKKLIANSLNILYDYLIKCNNKHLTGEVSSYLMLAVYKTFRLLYSSNSANSMGIFSLPDNLFEGYSDAAMSIAETNIGILARGLSVDDMEGIKDTDLLLMSTESISKINPSFATSLFNVIQYAETRIMPKKN